MSEEQVFNTKKAAGPMLSMICNGKKQQTNKQKTIFLHLVGEKNKHNPFKSHFITLKNLIKLLIINGILTSNVDILCKN